MVSGRQIIVVLIVCLCYSFSAQAQFITTIAGTDNSGNFGDDGPATCAGIPNPRSICLDGKGFLYLTASNSVRKIDLATNTITRVAGSDTYGYSGDGGQAKDALLQNPGGLCIDKNNNLYIAEAQGNRIRKVNLSTGIISTIAGTGTPGYSGDGGPAILATLNIPAGICVDVSDNLYIADVFNNRIRRIDILTGIINTFAGNGNRIFSGDNGPAILAGIANPNSIAIDASGNFYVAEAVSLLTSRVRKINALTGIITTIAGNNNFSYTGDGGPAQNAELFQPSGLSIDRSGNIYISQFGDSRIRQIDGTTGIISTIAGNGVNTLSGDGGPAITASLNHPAGLAHDNNGNLYIADDFNFRIRKIGASTVPPPVLPTTISIAASTEFSCQGVPVTFTATSVNPGFNAIYQWKVNGNPVNVIQKVFTTSILQNGDIVSCTLLAIICGINIQLNSTTIKMTVQPGIPPAAYINASDTAVCIGSSVLFTATTQNLSNQSYQWKLNGINIGTNSKTFTSSSLIDGDSIRCEVTGTNTSACGGKGIQRSNLIVMNVQSGQAAIINISSSDTEVCKGVPVTFTAVAGNAGTNPDYQWTLNGKNTGTNSKIYTNNSLSDNDAIICRVSSSGSACATLPVNSKEIRIRIKPTPVITMFPKDTLVTTGTQVRLSASVSGLYSSYNWSPANLLTSSSTLTPLTVALNNSVDFRLDMISAEGCSASATSSIRIFRKLYMPNAFTPNGDGVNEIYRIPPGVTITLYEFSIFDRWGNKIFTTKDINQGWNGTIKGIKSPVATYTYLIRGADTKGSTIEKGSLSLIR